ncbi:MAG: hypothetical protein QG604_50 [Candidatus Dependentiae bacterium]|nr:hypothetical protein [Candidatus Dependentiae bacterium]
MFVYGEMYGHRITIYYHLISPLLYLLLLNQPLSLSFFYSYPPILKILTILPSSSILLPSPSSSFTPSSLMGILCILIYPLSLYTYYYPYIPTIPILYIYPIYTLTLYTLTLYTLPRISALPLPSTPSLPLNCFFPSYASRKREVISPPPAASSFLFQLSRHGVWPEAGGIPRATGAGGRQPILRLSWAMRGQRAAGAPPNLFINVKPYSKIPIKSQQKARIIGHVCLERAQYD